MPTYEYKCKKCGYQFEEFQNITEKPLTKCPKKECTGTVYRIISSGAGFLFKGSGFYETDYRSESYKKAAKADKEKTTTPSSDKKSEDKKTEKSAPSNKKTNLPKKDS